MTEQRKISVGALTRVEGEGALHVTLDGDRVQDVRLSIYEPPRFFESFLRGRSIEEVPDITARICGICPVAYQMTSVHALEKALDVSITPEIRSLRRLLCCGEWIESHALHIFMLNAPDHFDCDSGIELAKQFPDELNDGLRIKQIGNTILETLGGRAIHPVNVRVGGFHRLPPADDLNEMLPDLRWALDASISAARWISRFEFPVFDTECEWVALKHPDEYPMNEGRIASSSHPTIDVTDYEKHFQEQHVPSSTALHSSRRDGNTPYYLGPLARLILNRDQLFPEARKLADEVYPESTRPNRFSSILARIIEVIHSIEEAIAIIEAYRGGGNAFVEYRHQSGFGCAATEAPRGMIYHAYSIDESGCVASAKIVPPTSQNQRQIELDLSEYLPSLIREPDAVIAAECERLIRTYDPCISCATHFLTLKMDRR